VKHVVVVGRHEVVVSIVDDVSHPKDLGDVLQGPAGLGEERLPELRCWEGASVDDGEEEHLDAHDEVVKEGHGA
jgi:hypothetical protein